jgi:hypothetical protein
VDDDRQVGPSRMVYLRLEHLPLHVAR